MSKRKAPTKRIAVQAVYNGDQQFLTLPLFDTVSGPAVNNPYGKIKGQPGVLMLDPDRIKPLPGDNDGYSYTGVLVTVNTLPAQK